jgi:hypothetical protein
VADDPVVVSKSRPEKPGNRVEDKTVTTFGLVQTGDRLPKASAVAKGRSFKEVFQGEKSNTCSTSEGRPFRNHPSGTPLTRALLDWTADAE